MNYLLQFIISGIVVVSAVYASNVIDQKWAGLIVALPLATLMAYIFISVSDSTNNQQFLKAALLFMIPASLFILSLYLLEGKFNLFVNILIGLIIFAPVALFVNKLIS